MITEHGMANLMAVIICIHHDHSLQPLTERTPALYCLQMAHTNNKHIGLQEVLILCSNSFNNRV